MTPLRKSNAMLLATDLDGTFLAGTSASRRRLYRLMDRRARQTLVWVTGRGRESVLSLLADPMLPQPDYVICDVGATVLDAADLRPVQPLQSRIESRWPGEYAVEDAMRAFPALVRQEVPQERRCSYYCSPGELAGIRDDVERVAASLGCEVLYSAGLYFDILPKGTSKGSTLAALVGELKFPSKQVLVAGDTLNDLSMYGEGFLGVCVGDAEPALLQATDDAPGVLHADETGCGGILQAIEHFGLLDPADLDGADAATGSAELVMVYHRLPYEEQVVDGERVRRPHASPNGIIPSLLSFFGDGQPGSWVAWTVDDPRQPSAPTHVPVDAARYPGLTAAHVPLSKTEVDVFYKRFSKEAFWPVINTFWERARFDEESWNLFKRINRRFAKVAAAEAAPGSVVWLHDYNLWMVPSVLRALRPDLRIAFFHHTQFPAADIFNILPWRREILSSLLACDYVGFHIPRHAENFAEAVRSALPVEVVARASCAPRFLTYGCAVGIDTMATALRVNGRTVRLGAHPIGTDLGRIRACLESEEAIADIARIRSQIGPRKLVLSIERLDYTKGILEKLQAFEHLLDESPELHGEVTLVVVCVPAAREMTIYRALQQKIEQTVGRINGSMSRLDWTPVRFFSRVLPFVEVVAHYAAADVMWITPLRDGLNLVAKEFVATQGLHGGDGVLVLSEFAGAAAELKGALLTNPHDHAELSRTLRRALSMERPERASRQNQMFDIVSRHDLARWGREFLACVREEGETEVAETM